MRRRSNRSAFTLVELLVVISIIGMLMALLFPAVQAARETARQNTCRNNIRNLALAANQYEKGKQTYPGYVNEFYPANGTTFSRRSWIFMLLPYLERSDIFDNTTYAAAGMQQPNVDLDIVKCPTNPNSGRNVWPSCSYVCNSGMPDVAPSAGTMASPGGYPADWQWNGVFHDRREYLTLGMSAVRYPVTRMTEGYISTGDGTSNTIMLLENADAASWVLVYDDSFPSSATTVTTDAPTRSYERQVGCNWITGGLSGSMPSSTGDQPSGAELTLGNSSMVSLYMNTGIDQDATYGNMAWARPAALHPNISNVAFCDGHVRPISADINYMVFIALMSPRNRSFLPAGLTATTATAAQSTSSPIRTYVLNEGDVH